MSATADDPRCGGFSRTLTWSACALGFSIGGFFDGILLHQVLQWHHLLSGLDASPFDDIRVQILADGFFHILMYVVGAVGLLLLWRARRELSLHGAGEMVTGGGLIGFGAWHVLDGILSHWVTGIHRIKMDSDVPLVWDLIWFVAFGLVPLVIGWRIRPNRRGGPLTGGHFASSVLVLLVTTAAPVAALPPRDMTGAIVVFRPGMSESEIMSAVQAVGGRMMWTDEAGGVWALDFDDPASARELYGRGALLVSNSLFPAGCLTWTRLS